jgi:3-oxoacyl-(acyl-carrier-protein) synthase
VPPSADPARRAVVTGMGAVMPIGNDFETYWRNLRDGVSGVARITAFDPSEFEVKIAAEVKGFRAADHMDAKMARRMSRFVHFAMAAAQEALASAGLDPATLDQDARDRFGVVVNTGGGGIEQIVEGTHVRQERGPRFVSPFAIPALSGSMAACMLSMEYGLTGPVMTQVAACATSVIAFHDALRLIATGECDVVLTGGTEAPVLEVGIAALGNMGALSKRNDDPTHASRPFDRDRDGFVLGEGGGVVVVESLAHALARGATPIAEVLGGALTADAFHISAPEPTGRGASRAMTMARERVRRDGGRDRLDRGPWHVHAAQRLDGVAGHQVVVRTGGLRARHQLAEVDDRAPRRSGGDRERPRGPRWAPRPGDLADGQPGEPRPARLRPRLRPRGRSPGEARHGHGQRVRVRRPERGGDLPQVPG